MKDPTLKVPLAMQASGFTVQESKERAKQMWIRRRIPAKRRLMQQQQQQQLQGLQPTTSSTTTTYTPIRIASSTTTPISSMTRSNTTPTSSTTTTTNNKPLLSQLPPPPFTHLGSNQQELVSTAGAAAIAAPGANLGGSWSHARATSFRSSTTTPVRIVSETNSEAEWMGGSDDNNIYHHVEEEIEAVDEENGEFECELQDWISCQRLDTDTTIMGVVGGQQQQQQQQQQTNKNKLVVGLMSTQQRTFLEETVQILYSLVGKIVGVGGGSSIGPDFITVSNVIVMRKSSSSTTLLGMGQHEMNNGQHVLSADFIRYGGIGSPSFCNECNINNNNDDDNETKQRMMYAAMHAFARLAYAICLMGNGPDLPGYITTTTSSEARQRSSSLVSPSSGGGAAAATEEDEDEIILDMIRKQYRVSESDEGNIDKSGYISAMIDAGIPFSMRRFIIDLLGDEQQQHDSGSRLERAFASFDDVLSDLKQMTINPDRFLHGSPSERWRIEFDDKLYGRGDEMEALMIAADRVTRRRVDAQLGENALSSRMAGKKSEIVMVSGHSGAGKSRLVKLGGACLEKKGWLFLRCKFDRVGEFIS
jgi:hypothetical protein